MSWKRLQDKTLKERLQLRARIIQLIREFFVKDGFLEVETPILVPFAGQEPYLNPMRVRFFDEKNEGKEGYLITSPEYAHKKLLAVGFTKTFEITKAFRGGEHFGGLHNPEFTMIEWYRSHADYTSIMQDVEKLIQYVVSGMQARQHGKSEIRNPKFETNSKIESSNDLTIKYQNKSIDLFSPWERLSVAEAFKRYADTNLEEVPDDDTFFKIFLTKIERKLGQTKPTILYGYPASMASLARVKDNVAERFEVYIAGMELGNAFSELNDAVEQRQRFLEEQKLRKKLGKEIIPLDEDFLGAVGHMPPSAGIAFGIDRLVMLLTDVKTIEEVLAFPAGELF